MTRAVTLTCTGLAVLLHAGGDRARRRFPVERLWNPFASFPRATKPGSTMSAQRRSARSCPKTCRAGSAGQGRWQVSRRRQTGSAAVKAHQDCETAMAYGLRAGDHCSGSVSPTAWMFSVQKRAVSGRQTLVGLLTVRSDGAGPCDAVPMQRRILTSLRAVLLTCVRPDCQGPVDRRSAGYAAKSQGVRARVAGQGCVRGRPGLLRHATRVGYRVGDMMCDGGFRQMGCGRSVFLGRLP